ncbi:MAG: hypothetical protein KDK39_15235 [Leptospiraceae bacterium]|nr:hypothetical protein [Leptospiraceae bacterium]
MSSSSLHRKNWRSRVYADHSRADENGPANNTDLSKHRNLHWLHAEMERLSEDVIDREICKRLCQFAGQIEYDLPIEVLRQIKASQTVDTNSIPEGILPFYRHYCFMVQRRERQDRS